MFIQNEVFVIHVGKSTIVMSRKIGLTIFVTLSIIFLYFAWIYDWGVSREIDVQESIKISSTWDEYIKDCGSKVVITNNLKATEIFKRKYKNNMIEWSGYFIEKKEVQSFSFVENSHSLNILIKMEPSETEFEPDIVLSFSGSVHQQYKQIIDSLKNGDQLNFSAKFISIGDEFTVNHLHAISLQNTGINKSLPEITINENMLPTSIPDSKNTN